MGQNPAILRLIVRPYPQEKGGLFLIYTKVLRGLVVILMSRIFQMKSQYTQDIMPCLKQKTPKSRKQTKKPHTCRMLNHCKVPGNFSPSIWFFLKEKNYPSVLSATLESLGREAKSWYAIKSNLERKEWEWYDLIH